MNREFVETITSMHGEAGRAWLASLPERVRDIERRWSLTLHDPFPNLTYNYVAPGVRSDGSGIVLKLGFPGEPDTRREPAALSAFGGRGMVRMLDSDVEAGAMLLERVSPGESLITMADDSEATRILAETMVLIRTPAPAKHDFPHIQDWARGFERLRERYGGGTGPMPPDLLGDAEELFAHLLDTTKEQYLLHGDLHHDNILDAGDGSWTGIDPKGVIGDAAYEPAAMLHNPPGLTGSSDLRRTLEARLDVLSDVTGLNRERILAWAKAQAVLSSVWTVEDHGKVGEEALVIACTLGDMISA